MGRKEELRRRYYEMSLAMTGRTPAEIKENLKKRLKESGTVELEAGGLQLNFVVRLFVILLLVFQAFVPFEIWKIEMTYLGILILAIIAVGVLTYVTKGAALNFSNIILTFLIPIAAIFILSAAVQALGSPNYYQVLGIKYGSTAAAVAFAGLAVMGGIVAYFAKSPLSLIIASVFFYAFLFLALPFALASAKVYGLCLKIPYLSQYCSAREVYIDQLKTVKIPVSGGITLKFGTEETNYQPTATLYGGEPYEFTFILTNYYEEPISFKLTPSMLSNYGSKLEFVQPFEQKTNSLEPKEFYQDSVFMDPKEMTVKEVYGCPYTALQISKTQSILVENVTCAYDSPCEDPKMACVKTGNFECDCVDWVKATCSKSSLEAKIVVKHTGFFRGNASLYYSEKLASPSAASELVQGPLSVIVEFQPNPYIATIHKYREDVSMYVTFKNYGGDMTIKSFKVEPQNTVIHTIDKEKEVELVEEVGAQVISCRNIEEVFPSAFLPNGEEASGKLCTLTPPSVKTTIRDLKNNQVTEINNVTYDRISYYCNKVRPESTGGEGYLSWSSVWDKIYEAVQKSGLCEMLEKKEDGGEKPIIESSLTHTEIIVAFTYERNATFLSQDIVPYTRTEECMKLAGSV
jgi:hypothetical protein